MDSVKLVIPLFVSNGRDDTAIAVTDDRGVVSDCIHVIKSIGSLIPLCIPRKIEQSI